MKLPFLLLGCAVVLSHQERNYFGAHKAIQSYLPFPNKRPESQLIVDEETADDFSEFLIARQGYRVAQHAGHQNPLPNFKSVQQPLINPFIVHQGQNSEADELNSFKSPSPLFRQNLESPAFSENFGAQSRNPIARPESRPFSWPSLFGLSTLHQSLDDERARYFFNYFSSVGSTNANANPFMKTIYFFTTATATSCSFISCIPASFFASGKASVICRRKKRDHEISDDKDKQGMDIAQEWSPSSLEKIETSEIVNQETFKSSSWAPDHFADLRSSKDDVAPDDGLHHIRVSPGRSKRLLYNYFIYSTTLTSYVITSKVTTLTLSNLASTSRLECRPNNVVICQ